MSFLRNNFGWCLFYPNYLFLFVFLYLTVEFRKSLLWCDVRNFSFRHWKISRNSTIINSIEVNVTPCERILKNKWSFDSCIDESYISKSILLMIIRSLDYFYANTLNTQFIENVKIYYFKYILLNYIAFVEY